MKPPLVKNSLGVLSPEGFPGLPKGWVTEADSLKSTDGQTKLFALFHRKKDQPVRRLLIVFHGFGEHAGRYWHFPHYLEHAVDAVYTMDHRGHGRSDGLRGFAPTFDLLVRDMATAVEHVHEKFPESELHVLGHSLGGHLALRLGFLHPELPYRTLSISAPFIGLKNEPPLALRATAHVLAKVWGTLALSSEFDPNVLSRDPAVVENYVADRLNHERMTPHLYVDMVKAQKDTMSRTSGISYPLLMILPLSDNLVDGAKSRKFFDQLEHPDKTLVELEGFRHEAMNDLGKERFFEPLAEFIRAHSAVKTEK